MEKSEIWSEFIFFVLIIFKVEARLPKNEAPQTILVNNMVVPAVRENQTEKNVDFTAEYHYVDGDIVNVTCVNLLNKDRAPLTMEYEMAGTTSDKSTVEDISSDKMIGFTAKLHAGHNNSYMICTNTGPKDYTKVMIRFVLLTKPNIIRISINGMILRQRPISAPNRNYKIKYIMNFLIIYQPMNVTCEVEQTDVKLLMLDDDFKETARKKTKIPHKKTELSFNVKPGNTKSVVCFADYFTGGLAESVNIEFTTANFPIELFSSLHMELPPSGTVMELYSYQPYKLSVILYELKQNETLHLTCGPLPFPERLHLQLNNIVSEKCDYYGCNVSTTLQHVSRERVHPPIVCYLKENPNTGVAVLKEIRVILLERALAVTEPSSSNNNTLAYWLISLGIVIVIIIIVVVLIRKRCCGRWSLLIPTPRPDIPLGDLTNENSNTNDRGVENMGLGEPCYTEIDYSRCKPKVTEAPLRNSYIYDEPYRH